MKQIFGTLAVLIALTLPALSQRMPAADQDRFNSYYSRWLQDRQTGDRDDMISTEQRMQDLMSRYSIPSDTPYDQEASQFGGYRQREYYRITVAVWDSGREDCQKMIRRNSTKSTASGWIPAQRTTAMTSINMHAKWKRSWRDTKSPPTLRSM